MSSIATGSRTDASALLEHVGKCFDAATTRLAQLCGHDGKLVPRLLDRHQWSSYQLALADADLLAAREVVHAADASDLDVGLGLAYAVDAISSVLAKLEDIYIATDLDIAPLHDIAASAELHRLRRAAAHPDVLARLGLAVANATGELGDVAMDEQTAMARDAFRRFAEDVVAPVAADIHRRDLTVPESLLQPMREMGV